MSLLRRIVQLPALPKAVPIAKTSVRYPLPYSVPKLDRIPSSYIDNRPISLRYRVSAMIEMCNLDEASKLSRISVRGEDLRVDKDTIFICNSVIGAMFKANRYDEALSLFDFFFNDYQIKPNTLSCNLIIEAHCDQGRLEDALKLYHHMDDNGLAPGIETYRILTKALVVAKRLDEACELAASMRRFDYMVYDFLLGGFLDEGDYKEASRIFEEVKIPWRSYHRAMSVFKVSFMKFWFEQGNDQKAMEIYNALINVELLYPVVGNKALRVLLDHGKRDEACELFYMISCNSESVDIMFEFGVSFPFEWVTKRCYKALIDNHCKQGEMFEARKIFDEMFFVDSAGFGLEMAPGLDVSTYKAMINGYVNSAKVDDAIDMLDMMKISNLRKLAMYEEPQLAPEIYEFLMNSDHGYSRVSTM
ncbi:unnamed protein product [Cochlearia groenlandica]